MVKVEFRVDSPEHGISAVFRARFDIALKAMEQEGYHLISFSENMLLRIREFERHSRYINQLKKHGVEDGGGGIVGIYHNIPHTISLGNRVSESVVYIPGDGRYITKNSPAMKRPEEFVAAKKAGRPFYIIPSEVKEALEDSVRVPYEFPYRITEDKFKDATDRVPVSKFDKDEVMSFCFRGSYGGISEYVKILRKFDIKSVPVCLHEEGHVNAQEQPYAEQLSFGGTGNYSAIWTINDDMRGYFFQGPLDRVVEVKE